MFYGSYDEVSKVAETLNGDMADDWSYVIEARGYYWAIVAYDEDGNKLGDL